MADDRWIEFSGCQYYAKAHSEHAIASGSCEIVWLSKDRELRTHTRSVNGSNDVNLLSVGRLYIAPALNHLSRHLLAGVQPPWSGGT